MQNRLTTKYLDEEEPGLERRKLNYFLAFVRIIYIFSSKENLVKYHVAQAVFRIEIRTSFQKPNAAVLILVNS